MTTGQSSRSNYRRAIEALRAGVPNRDAVRFLGSSQYKLEERFAQQLAALKIQTSPERQPGMIFAGDFGSGKSHLLERFQHMALEQGFVCSKVVISKETPFYRIDKVYRSAIESATIPGRTGACMSELAISLDTRSESYTQFFRWLNSPESGLCNHFAATVHLYERTHGYDVDSVVSFWAGYPLGVQELRRALKDVGLGAVYRIERVRASALAEQLFVFAPRLMKVAGHAGWVILIDEAELIASYGIRSRALAYAEIPRYLGASTGRSWPGITVVMSITSDFVAKVLEDRDDEGKIPSKYPGEKEMVQRAERGMKLIREASLLERPKLDSVKQTWDRVRHIYHMAYDWVPPDEYSYPDLTNSMRQILKRWITEWDLERLFGHRGSIEVKALEQRIEEDPEMETPTESDTDDDSVNSAR